jgi:hypothetical protein
VILGYDWLEAFSPMKIHWGEKWLEVPYGAGTIPIHGILSSLSSGSVVQVHCLSEEDLKLDTDDSHVVSSEWPVETHQLLSSFAGIFATKVQYPPPRSCSNSIPLIPGVGPVNIRSYRYSPILKSEIEKQVQEMLEAGLIQPSTSPFSSPVLLIKKKDNTFRFCVD